MLSTMSRIISDYYALKKYQTRTLRLNSSSVCKETLVKRLSQMKSKLYRVGARRITDHDDQRSTQSPKPQVVNTKLVSNKIKMHLLAK